MPRQAIIIEHRLPELRHGTASGRGGFYRPRASDYAPTGEISLQLEGVYGARRRSSWKDTGRQPIETCLGEVMLGLRSLAAYQNAEVARQALRQRRYEAAQRLRRELRERIAAERAAVAALEADAQAWRRAEHLRDYVAAAAARGIDMDARCGRRGWRAWAQAQADRLDPLCASPASILDTPEKAWRDISLWELREEDAG